MKILHVYKTYLPDDFTGIPRVIHAIASTLSGWGVDIDVLAVGNESTGRQPIAIDGHRVHLAKRDLKLASTDFSWEAIAQFRSLAANADVVHYHFPWPAGDILYWLAGRGSPTVVTYHSDIVKQRVTRRVYEPFMHRFLDSVDCIVATSPPYVATSRVLGRHKSSVSVIPIGIGPRSAPDSSAIASYRERLGEGFFLFLGTMRYYKGIPYLIEAARLTGLPVVLAGATDPALVGNLPPNVNVLGEVSDADKEALLELCAAFVMPSHLRAEAFGIALLEAARAGRALISCELGTGTSYVNVQNETGIVIPPADPPALASAMQHIVRHPERAAEMGRRARQRFSSHFTAEKMADSYLQIYQKLHARKSVV